MCTRSVAHSFWHKKMQLAFELPFLMRGWGLGMRLPHPMLMIVVYYTCGPHSHNVFHCSYLLILCTGLSREFLMAKQCTLMSVTECMLSEWCLCSLQPARHVVPWAGGSSGPDCTVPLPGCAAVQVGREQGCLWCGTVGDHPAPTALLPSGNTHRRRL